MNNRTYILTSPLTKDDGVAAFQNSLTKHKWYHGKVDGIYDQETAQAVYRAKFWLGYPKPDQAAGDKLYGFLTGAATPPLAYRALAAKRKKAAITQETIGMKMAKASIKYLGVHESPANSNRTQFGTWYGVYCAWCNIFVSKCGADAGSTVFKKGVHYSYVPYFLQDARAGRNNLTITTAPMVGDCPCYDWDGGEPDHVGIFVTEAFLKEYAPKALITTINEVGPLRQGEFWAIEGNTGYGNDSNGGIVMIRKRKFSQVDGFVRVGR